MYIVDRRPYLLNSEWKAILRGHLLKQQKLICPADKESISRRNRLFHLSLEQYVRREARFKQFTVTFVDNIEQ